MIGRTLSHYRIEERLGAGGMGEVYRARDEKLGRDVALKVLPAGSLADEESRRRFRKEAAVLSRLSHPHIATLHDFDSAEGIDFLVMELVTGPTLEQELRKGPRPEKDVVRMGSQLARALVAAHEQGVIHRDLKPSNLQLTSDGMLKILDFGVAHLEQGGAPIGGEATATETAAGEVLGSPPYMAPEQLLGKPVDARTDLYAAGACLYELATGKRPHGDKRGPQLTEAILHEAPAPPRDQDGSVSPGLQSAILKALDKDPELRFQTAKELLVDLERLQAGATSGSASPSVAGIVGKRGRWTWLAAAAATTVVALAAAAWLSWPGPPPRITGIRPVTRGLTPIRTHNPSMTTDGPRIYYTTVKDGDWAVFQIPAGGGQPEQIPLPFKGPMFVLGYSRSESVLLIATDPNLAGWSLWTTPITGGAPRRLGDLRHPAALSPDGRRIATIDWETSNLAVADLDGTASRTIARVPSGSRGLRWSPDGTRLRFNGRGPKGHESEFWKWEATVDGGTVEPLWEGEGGDWTPDGRFFVFNRRTSARNPADLYVARESRRWGRRRASVTRLTFGPHAFFGPLLSLDGSRIFAFGEEPRAELMRWEATQERFVPFLGGSSAGMVDASSDGRWLAWVSFPDGILWRSRREGSERLQLTSGSAYAYLPRWSPDGTRIAYAAEGQGDWRHSIRVIAMTGGAEAIVASPAAPDHCYWDPCWLPDGRTILFSNLVDVQPPGIHRVDVDTLQRDLLPGSEYLKYPKCGRQGQVLAQQVGRFGEPAPADGYGFKVLWPDRSTWESIGDLALNYPSWSRDGRFLYGLNLQARRVQRLALDGRRLEDVAPVAFPLANWVFNPWFGIDVDDAPMLMADRGTYEIYALDWEAP